MMEHQWGPIADRAQEHLTSMDHMIIYVRRRLLTAAKDLANGIEPAAPWHPEQYRMHRVIVERADGDVEAAEREARAQALGSVIEAERVEVSIARVTTGFENTKGAGSHLRPFCLSCGRRLVS